MPGKQQRKLVLTQQMLAIGLPDKPGLLWDELPVPDLGQRWNEVRKSKIFNSEVSDRMIRARELKNERLVKALSRGRALFTSEELEEMDLRDNLRCNSWVTVGSKFFRPTGPDEGIEVFSTSLSSKLQKRQRIERDELQEYELLNLSFESFILAGDKYFRPIQGIEVLQRACLLCVCVCGASACVCKGMEALPRAKSCALGYADPMGQ